MSRMIRADEPGDEARAVTLETGTRAISSRGLSRRYGARLALNHVDLEVPAGSVYVLVGANGAGKSTTLKILMNLERADAGSADVFGLDTVRQGPAVRAQVGYVPERHDDAPRWMTCAGLLRHVATYFPRWDRVYAERLSREFGIVPGRRVGTLSKGEARRLQLVLAMAHRPPLLILDEPTDGLDPVVRKRTLTLLAEHLADAPTTVLISTHRIYEVESLADHVGVLREGRLVAQMPRDELQRTVRGYRIEVPEGWQAPPDVRFTAPRRSSTGREIVCTLVGAEPEVIERLDRAGARVLEVTTLALEDATLAFLTEEEA